MLLYSLLFASTISPVVFGAVLNAQGRLTQCRVKRQGVQALAATPSNTAQATLPVNNTPSPSVTQEVVPSPVFEHMTIPPFDYANQKVRGVNLGGWFMMEVRAILTYSDVDTDQIVALDHTEHVRENWQ